MNKLELKAGDRIKILHNKNNKTIQVRAIVDKIKAVVRVWSRKNKKWIYNLEDISRFESLYEEGKLIKTL